MATQGVEINHHAYCVCLMDAHMTQPFSAGCCLVFLLSCMFAEAHANCRRMLMVRCCSVLFTAMPLVWCLCHTGFTRSLFRTFSSLRRQSLRCAAAAASSAG